MRLNRILLCLLFPLLLSTTPALAQNPSVWQTSATGMKTAIDDKSMTGGLGLVVKQENWPRIMARGGAQDVSQWNAPHKLGSTTTIDLGQIAIPGATGFFSSEAADWSYDELSYNQNQLSVRVSRLTPAILIHTSSPTLALFSGSVTGNQVTNGQVSSRPTGPAYPKYVAYQSNGIIHVQTLSTTPLTLPTLDAPWLLIWYGTNSPFIHSTEPLTYNSIDWSSAFQGDLPFLLQFEAKPLSINQNNSGGITVTSDKAGYTIILPLFAEKIVNSADTETWRSSLPSNVTTQITWWSNRLCRFPLTVTETYTNDGGNPVITEAFTYQSVCPSSLTFAPLPPSLSLARQKLPINFSASVIASNLNTEYGPYEGIDGVTSYTWSVLVVDRYRHISRNLQANHSPPAELEQQLEQQVTALIAGNHWAPWLFNNHIPTSDDQGDIYFMNPGENLYYLIEIAEALDQNSPLYQNLKNYITSERHAYPPETTASLSITAGTQRQYFQYLTSDSPSRWRSMYPYLFPNKATLFNLYSLARYYRFMDSSPPASLLQQANSILDQAMMEQDWATGSWFRSFETDRVASYQTQRHLLGLIGYTNLAEMISDPNALTLGKALLAKAIVLEVAQLNYTPYLYAAGLTTLPSDPAWQPKSTAGIWFGYLPNYNWISPDQDIRQVVKMNQIRAQLADSKMFWTYAPFELNHEYLWAMQSAELIAYRYLTPELFRIMHDYFPQTAGMYAAKVTSIIPQWYHPYIEAYIGAEHNLSHPSDSYQLFMYQALSQSLSPAQLTKYVSFPWLESADLFYMHKLAEAVKSDRGWTWSDTTITPSPTPVTDYNGDGFTDIQDLLYLVSHFGNPFTIFNLNQLISHL